MAIVNAMKSGTYEPGSTKRVKTTETDEKVSNLPNDLDIFNQLLDQTTPVQPDANIVSDDQYDAEVSSDVVSSSEEEIGILKTEKWLQQNDIYENIYSQGPDTSTANRNSDADRKLTAENQQNDDKFVLQRDQETPLFNSVFGDTIGDALSHGSMLMLNIVMCLVCLFCKEESEPSRNSNRYYHALIPGMRSMQTFNKYELGSYSNMYLFALFTLLCASIACFVKIRSTIKFRHPKNLNNDKHMTKRDVQQVRN